MSGNNSPSSRSGNSPSGRVNTRDLLKQWGSSVRSSHESSRGTDTEDSPTGRRTGADVLNRMGIQTDEDKVQRAATLLMGPLAMDFGPRQVGMAPVGLSGPGFQSFNLGPAQKNQSPSPFNAPIAPPSKQIHVEITDMPMELEMEQELDLPDMLEMPMWGFEDDTQEMIDTMQEEAPDQTLPRLDQHEFGCKTSVVSSYNPKEVQLALRNALALLESGNKEITHESEGWQMRVEYIYNHSSAGININLLENDDGHVVILFNRARGSSTVFQRFYREFLEQLQFAGLGDLRQLHGEGMPMVQTLDGQFDRSGLEVNPVHVKEALAANLRLLASVQDYVEPIREITAALLQLVSAHPQIALEFAATNKDAMSNLPMTLSNQMKMFRGDHDIMQNCSRTFSILMEHGSNVEHKTRLRQLLYPTSIFDSMAHNIAERVQERAVCSNVMVCNQLCKFLHHLAPYYSQHKRVPSVEALTALHTVVDSQGDEKFGRVRNECRKALASVTSF